MIENKQNIKSVIMNQDDKIFELEKQLHEGYVVNNNAKAGFLASLIAAIVSAIGAYGYVFAHTVPWFASIVKPYYFQEHMFTLDVLVMAMLACQFVLVVLYCISCSLGVTQRLEQFITFAIRCKVYENKSKAYTDIFPKKYCPFGKEGKDIIIGIFGKMCCVLKVIFIIITLATFFRLFSCCCYCCCCNIMTRCSSILWFIIGSVGTILFLYMFKIIFDCNAKKYEDREKEYCVKKIVCPFITANGLEATCEKICYQNKEKSVCKLAKKC